MPKDENELNIARHAEKINPRLTTKLHSLGFELSSCRPILSESLEHAMEPPTSMPRAPSCFSLMAMASFFFSKRVDRRTSDTYREHKESKWLERGCTGNISELFLEFLLFSVKYEVPWLILICWGGHREHLNVCLSLKGNSLLFVLSE